MMKKGNISTQELLGVKSFSRNGIQTDGHGELVYFMITPTNISVLSRVSIGQKVHHLMQLLSAQPDMEIICTDARENFDDNKLYLDDRAENESNKKVRDLLLRDKAFLDDIQLQMSTAREFLFVVRLRNESDEQSFANLNRVEKLINEQGFNCRRAERDDVKRILALYFGVGQTDAAIDDTDGETVVQKWVIPD
ncbi:MAG: hypothetical protein IJF78_10540 [Clostridia bacterium]|nr:hypothetical protein [Clostridia bacterium]